MQPGSGETGMVAAGGSVPIGYFKDEKKSKATFREIGGVRYSFPGDWARVEADGTLTLLGRGSNCINTAGEKVYPEEVEEAVKSHDDVFDCLVVGVEDEKFGQRVTGAVSLQCGRHGLARRVACIHQDEVGRLQSAKAAFSGRPSEARTEWQS